MVRKLLYDIALYQRVTVKDEYGCEKAVYKMLKQVKGSFSDRDYEKGLNQRPYALEAKDRMTVYMKGCENIKEADGISVLGRDSFYEIIKVRHYHSHMKLTAERRADAEWISREKL